MLADGRLQQPTKLSAVVADALRRWYLETEKEALRGDVVSRGAGRSGAQHHRMHACAGAQGSAQLRAWWRARGAAAATPSTARPLPALLPPLPCPPVPAEGAGAAGTDADRGVWLRG